MSNPIGRPTDYTPEMHNRVVKLMRKGASIKEVAYKLNVSRQTIYEWKEKYPEFSDTITQGVEFSEGWWEMKGRRNLHTKNFNSALYQINMRNRFGWDKNDHNVNVSVSETKNKMTDADEQYKKPV